MNFLKKGPEVKLSAIEVPGPVQDVYYDLKDRHLLPLAAILLLAIIVVPFALSKSSGGPTKGAAESAAAEASVAATSSATTGSSSGELVAKSAPGLRDYKQRLSHLKSKNPFRQQYQTSKGGEGGGSSSSEGSGESTATTTTTEAETETSTSGDASGENSGTSTGHIVYFSYAIDVRVTSGGAQSSAASGGGGETQTDQKVQVRHNLPELTKLPSRETPAFIYMGSTRDGKKALMLVSSNVSALFGDAICALGSSTCELLALEVGVPETIVYGTSGRTYKIELLKISLLETSKLNRAPLGKPHKHPEGE